MRLGSHKIYAAEMEEVRVKIVKGSVAVMIIHIHIHIHIHTQMYIEMKARKKVERC